MHRRIKGYAGAASQAAEKSTQGTRGPCASDDPSLSLQSWSESIQHCAPTAAAAPRPRSRRPPRPAATAGFLLSSPLHLTSPARLPYVLSPALCGGRTSRRFLCPAARATAASRPSFHRDRLGLLGALLQLPLAVVPPLPERRRLTPSPPIKTRHNGSLVPSTPAGLVSLSKRENDRLHPMSTREELEKTEDRRNKLSGQRMHLSVLVDDLELSQLRCSGRDPCYVYVDHVLYCILSVVRKKKICYIRDFSFVGD